MKRYSLTIRVDKPLIEEAKLYFEKLRRRRAFTDREAPLFFSVPTSRLWDQAYTVLVNGQRGIVIPHPGDKSGSKGSTPFFQSHISLLILKNYQAAFICEFVQFIPDYHTNPARSFSGSLVPAYSITNLLCSTLRKYSRAHGLQYGSLLTGEVRNEPLGYEVKNKPEKKHTVLGVNAGYNKIGNITDYLKCFDNIPGNDHLYEVILCVDQPKRNSREPWSFSEKNRKKSGNPVFVGHTFLIMKETTSNKVILRNVGFYPAGFVWPYKSMEQGELINDSYHEYNIALTIQVTSHEFTQILTFIRQGNDKGYKYDLNSNNCTTFALNAIGVTGIHLPRTTGHWDNGSGLNPGDLGEDLRTLTLSSTMRLSTSYHAHGNLGDCI